MNDKIALACVLTVIFVIVVRPFSYLRYYYEDFTDGQSEFFSGIAICAENENKQSDYEVFENDSDKNVMYIPAKYRKYKFYFSGEIVNGIKDVYISVNNEPVENVDLSFPQGNNFFFEYLYLVKRFNCYINLRNGTNVIFLKSGKATNKIIVKVGD